eukprot:658809-Rhodomonas_salina.2
MSTTSTSYDATRCPVLTYTMMLRRPASSSTSRGRQGSAGNVLLPDAMHVTGLGSATRCPVLTEAIGWY